MNIELAQQIFNLVLVPLFGILVAYVIKYINAQRDRLKEITDNELIWKYIDILHNIIATCVIATNQTYVNALKEKNAFTKEAQEEAFKKTFEAVKSILSDELVNILSMVYEDLDAYITEQIELIVHLNRENFNNNWDNDDSVVPPLNYTYNN